MRLVFAIVGVALVMLIARCGFIAVKYRAVSAGGGSTWRVMQHPFYSDEKSMAFLVDHDMEIPLSLWWDGLTGSVDVRIVDGDGNECFHERAGRINHTYSVPLNAGSYEMRMDIRRFSGVVVVMYDDIVMVCDLPDDRYTLVPADPAKGFGWEYLLYVPETVAYGNLLVVPNNTGYPTDNMDIHREQAKGLFIEDSGMADDLGVPLLVPVFPRPASHEELYTHALDRAALLTDVEGLERLDMQLIAMIDDAKNRLRQQGITPEDEIFMSGFSASGDFTDRFTVLHPSLVRAAAMGGCDSVLPVASRNGENLPYPIGVYDYEAITGESFDLDAFGRVYRCLYKGSADEGGWEIIEENGETVTYTGKEYYEKYTLPQIETDLEGRPSPIYIGGDMSDIDEKEIAYRVYNGKILADRFLAAKSVFAEMNLTKNECKVYEGVGHDITDGMRENEIAFFRRVLAGE